MRVLVTGGAGFIGSHLVDRLLWKEHDVTVVDNLTTGSMGNLASVLDNKDLECVKGDVSDPSWVKLDGYDCIFHLAALARIQPSFTTPDRCHQVNVLGTVRMLELARFCKCPLIYAGSSSCLNDVYLNPYTFSKHQAEECCQLYTRIYKVPALVLRFHNVYGNRQIAKGPYETVIGVFERQRKAGEPLTITGTGTQRRDFTHVADIVVGLMRAWEGLREAVAGKGFLGLLGHPPISLGTGITYSINEIAGLFGGPTEFIPARPGEARETSADCHASREQLGWRSAVGLRYYIEDFLADEVAV